MILGIKDGLGTTLAKEMKNGDLMITNTTVTKAHFCDQFDSKKYLAVNSITIEHQMPTSDQPQTTQPKAATGHQGRPTTIRATDTVLVATPEATIKNVGTVNARNMPPENRRLASTAFVLATSDGIKEPHEPTRKTKRVYAKEPFRRRELLLNWPQKNCNAQRNGRPRSVFVKMKI